MREIFAHLGYPLYLLSILGIAKVLAVIGLVTPRARRVREWTYAGVFFVYAGAACSHYAIGDGVDKIGMPLSLAALTLVSSALWAGSRHDANAHQVREQELSMRGLVPVESASASIDERIKELGDWRGKTLARVRAIIHDADPEIVEEWKWVKPTNPGTPVWSHGGIVCTGETYKNAVKMTFAQGAQLKDPAGLFNSSLDGNVRRAIDIHEGDTVDETALKDLIRAAVALNLKDNGKPKSPRATSNPRSRRG